MKQYYYAVGDVKKGPVSLDELKAVGITPDTLVWYEGMDNWAAAVELTDFTDLFGGLTPSALPPDGLNEDLNEAASAAGDAIEKAADAVEGMADKAGESLGDAANAAGDMLSGTANKAGSVAKGAGASLGGAMADAAGDASAAFGKAGGALSRAADNAGGAMSTGFKRSDSLAGAPPKTWLLESILVTVLCCIPFGIAGIVNATKVETLFYAGDVAGAQRASEEAGKWTKIGGGIGILLYVLIFLFYGAIIVAALNS